LEAADIFNRKARAVSAEAARNLEIVVAFRLAILLCLSAASAAAQFGGAFALDSSVPGTEAGTRGGDPVDLRFYAGVSGIYDTGLQPFAVDAKGNLVVAKGLYGEEATLGAYGTHLWEHARLGLDYWGDFRHYAPSNYLSGTDQRLALDYKVQTSKRLLFEVKGAGGIFSDGLGPFGGYSIPAYGIVDQPGLTLFDDRVYFGEGGASVTYVLSAHTAATVGGKGFITRYRSAGLANLNGYALRGSLQHRASRHNTVGALYERLDFEYSGAFGQFTIDTLEGLLESQLSRHWTLDLRAGAFLAQVQGLHQTPVDPVITALLGVTTTTATYNTERVFPAGEAYASRKFRKALLTFSYIRYVTPGNGVYLASRNESGMASLSYSGTRKLSLSASGGAFVYRSIGQGLQTYTQANGGAGFSYEILRSLHLTARYDLRRQDISSLIYNRTSYRATLGLTFSPGIYPLRLR